jgi:hypothetical protein
MTGNIIKNNIKVICKKTNGSLKLVKGGEYEITRLTTIFGKRCVNIQNLGSYKVDNFVLEDGQPVSNLNDFYTEIPEIIDCEHKNYTGQFVRCRFSYSKDLKEGEIYYVENQIKEECSMIITKYYKYFLKIRGVKNKVQSYAFEELPLEEQRYIKLKTLNGTEIKTGEQTRKFLLYTEAERIAILFDLLAKSLSDCNKSKGIENTKKIIVDMMLMKGRKYVVNIEDIENFINKNITDLIK